MLATSDISPWLAVFGRFHIVLLHLPIGLLPGMFLLEFGALILRRTQPRGAVMALAVLTALAAVMALATGLVRAQEKVDTDLLAQHMYLGIAMAVICVLLPLLALRRGRGPFRIALAIGVMVSIPTGHLGGDLTHKKNFLFRPLERAAAKAADAIADSATVPVRDIEGATDKGQNAPAASPPSGRSRFQTQIAQIFERVCTDCHNPEDAEGDLVLTTKKGIMRPDWDLEDRIIVPGKPDESWLIEVCELAIDDEDHMPPEDEEQLTEKELATLRKWIADGCPFE